MGTSRAVCLFELNKFLRSSRLLIPFMVLICYLSITYFSVPISIQSSYGICSLIVFLLMLLVGVRFDDINFSKIEETVIVKIKRKHNFYIGKLLLLAGIALFYALLATFWPIGVDYLYQSIKEVTIFTRAIRLSDILSAFVMFFFSGLCGGLGGIFLNIRILRRVELVILATFIYGFVTVVRGPFNEYLPGIGLITWILPPIYDMTNLYSHQEYFSFASSWFIYARIISYALIESVIYLYIMTKKGFD